jgi:hypothetical protein
MSVLRGQQIDLVVGHQGGILACRDVAALDQDGAVFASAGGDDVDVAASLYATAMRWQCRLVAVALALAGAQVDGDADPTTGGIALAQRLTASWLL